MFSVRKLKNNVTTANKHKKGFWCNKAEKSVV